MNLVIDPAAQIAGLVSAIGVMGGFIVWLFKDALSRADKVAAMWKEQSDKKDAVIAQQGETNRGLAGSLNTALDALKRIEDNQRPNNRGGRDG
jgi:hypothetical protein